MYPKPSFGDTFGWSKGARNAFPGACFFTRLRCRLGLRFGFLRNSKTGASSCIWGCVKAPLGSSVVPKAFLWEHFWMVQRGLQRIFWGPGFQSSPMPARDIFRVALKKRTRRVQLHVGLCKGSPGEFSCTQSLPLGALLDGRKGLGTHFLGPDFSLVLDAG